MAKSPLREANPSTRNIWLSVGAQLFVAMRFKVPPRFTDPLTTNRQALVADLALKHRLPTMMEYKEFAKVGGLLGLGVDLADLYRRSATHVDKILKGTQPADLPMEQPVKLDVAVNLSTARALGLTIPATILQQATDVVQ